ncbi:uncharacterized protein LOC121373238 [Gigantopelta aegis]|uniref:uncharacterized protein LOC121373238 n=1 Tax=Gigantopelta aegis TaxID=1735272 RepID=UPI001B88B312|nr:uncharacterized protein LOC121373238 [Gigantopelta aegis]
MSSDVLSLGGFDALHLLGAVMVAGICAIIIYSLWDCCNQDESPTNSPRDERVVVNQLYATELEPGLVVLQSQDGAYFRILQECESAEFRNERPGTSGNKQTFLNGDPVTYIPRNTRTEVRNVATAPQPSDENLMAWNVQPPPYGN